MGSPAQLVSEPGHVLTSGHWRFAVLPTPHSGDPAYSHGVVVATLSNSDPLDPMNIHLQLPGRRTFQGSRYFVLQARYTLLRLDDGGVTLAFCPVRDNLPYWHKLLPLPLVELPRAIDLLSHHATGFFHSDHESQILWKALAHIHSLDIRRPARVWEHPVYYDWYLTVLTLQYRLKIDELRTCVRSTEKGEVWGFLDKVQLTMMPMAWADFTFATTEGTNESFSLLFQSGADFRASSIVFLKDIQE